MSIELIVTGEWPGFERIPVARGKATLSVRVGGPTDGAAILLNHSILTGSAIWHRTAMMLAGSGWRVICPDTRGHGRSGAPAGPYTMDDLVAGVSLGGMTGIGLGCRHSDRILSLCIIAARADAPPLFAAAWEPRIELVGREGIAPLAGPTAVRWCGQPFLDANPAISRSLHACILETSPAGFVGCARAIQSLAYRDVLQRIAVPLTFVIGMDDQLLLQPMRDLAAAMPGSSLAEIEGAGHLPQIDRPDQLQAVLEQHLETASSQSRSH